MTRFHSLFLLSIPVLAMGGVFLLFGLLSVLLFHDKVHVAFFELAAVLLATGVAGLFGISRKLESIGYRESMLFVSVTGGRRIVSVGVR